MGIVITVPLLCLLIIGTIISCLSRRCTTVCMTSFNFPPCGQIQHSTSSNYHQPYIGNNCSERPCLAGRTLSCSQPLQPLPYILITQRRLKWYEQCELRELRELHELRGRRRQDRGEGGFERRETSFSASGQPKPSIKIALAQSHGLALQLFRQLVIIRRGRMP